MTSLKTGFTKAYISELTSELVALWKGNRFSKTPGTISSRFKTRAAVVMYKIGNQDSKNAMEIMKKTNFGARCG